MGAADIVSCAEKQPCRAPSPVFLDAGTLCQQKSELFPLFLKGSCL